jgi:hypothetical protein
MEPDSDGIYRRAPLLYEWDGGYIPSLPLAAAVSFYGIPVKSIELKAGSYLALPSSETEVIRIPIDEKGANAYSIHRYLGGLEKRAFIGWASLPYKIIIMIALLAAAFFA